MYLAKHVGGWSLPKIGRYYNGRHYTAVLRAVRKIERLRRCDEALDALPEVLTATFGAEAKSAASSGKKTFMHSELIDAVASRVMERMAELNSDPVP